MDRSANRIPSRDDNPFATCWTKPGAITYRFPAGETLAALVDRLASRGWRGQILGPHGSGKSTLMTDLCQHLARSRAVRAVEVRDRRLRRSGDWSWGELKPGDVLTIDGYDQLRVWARWGIAVRAWLHGCGLVVTTHRRLAWLTVLARTAPDPMLVQRLVDELTASVPDVVKPGDIAASFAMHNGNVREIFFDLYDRYERHAREVTNCAPSVRVSISRARSDSSASIAADAKPAMVNDEGSQQAS